MESKCISSDPSKCCGCGLCAQICPVHAIDMQEDEYGFAIPVVDTDICLNCGLCSKHCCFSNADLFKNEVANDVYAAVIKDKRQLIKSSSGGLFAGFALYVLKNGGVVYGAAWQMDFSVKHIGITDSNDLYKLQGSKYTQSNIQQCLSDIERQLNSGTMVLFSGTPCQNATIKSYLKKDYSNLYLIDLICHGVGSNRMLQDDIKYLENKYKGHISALSFRSKRKGWGTSGEVIVDGNIKTFNTIVSPYYYYYLDDAIFRESCYYCPYSCDHRPGDITIGDYWRIESAHPEITADLNQGVSCLLINSIKGKELFGLVKDKFDFWESNLEMVKSRNGNLKAPSLKSSKRSIIMKRYKEYGYNDMCNYWISHERCARIKLRIKQMIPSNIKHLLKRG